MKRQNNQPKFITPNRIVAPHQFSKLITTPIVGQLPLDATITAHEILTPGYNPASPALKVNLSKYSGKCKSPAADNISISASAASRSGSSNISITSSPILRNPYLPRSLTDVSSSAAAAVSQQKSPSNRPSSATNTINTSTAIPTSSRKTIIEMEEELLQEMKTLKKAQRDTETSRKLNTKMRLQLRKKLKQNHFKAKQLVDSVKSVKATLESIEISAKSEDEM